MFTEITILLFQFIATLLMGLGYFLPKNLIEEIDESALDEINTKYKLAKIESSNQYLVFKRSLPYILFGLIIFFSPKYFLNLMPGSHPYLIIFLGLVAIFAFLFGSYLTFASLKLGVIPMVPAYSKKFFLYYLSVCPKGPMAGLGFFILMASFLMQFYNAFQA